jgi:hypothetical protein
LPRAARTDLDTWLEHPQAGEMLVAMLHLTPDVRDIPVLMCTTDVRFLHERAASLRSERCEVLLLPVALDDLQAAIDHLLFLFQREHEHSMRTRQ